MTLQRMDNIGIVVADLAAAIAFFEEIGLELEGQAPVEGEWASRMVGLPDMKVEIAMMRMPVGGGPTGNCKVELVQFRRPAAVATEPNNAPPHALGIRRIMFAVDDLEEILARLRRRGAELVGEVTQYEDKYRLCLVRGPEGILVALAQQLC